jgi:hypothetical protein
LASASSSEYPALVSRDVGLRLRGRQLRGPAVESGLGLLVSLPRHPADGVELPAGCLVGFCLDGYGARCCDGVFFGGKRKIEILLIEAYERLAGADVLPGIDEALDHLARHAKSEIALDARGDDARKSPLGGAGPAR